MSADNEKQTILNLVRSNSISPEEGARLLMAVSAPSRTEGRELPVITASPPTTADTRLLKLHVEEPSGHRVDLSIPINGVPAVLGFIARWVPDEYQVTLRSAADALTTGYRGDLLNVAEPSGESVRLWIE